MQKISKRVIERFQSEGIVLNFTGYTYYLIHKEDTFYDILVFNEAQNSFYLHRNTFPDLCSFSECADASKVFKELKTKINAINDDRLAFTLNLRYFHVGKDKLVHYSNLDKVKYIPLSTKKEEFVIDYRTITKHNIKTLFKSGYIWLNVPYFAMNGKTHDYDTISFGSKRIINAAPIDSKNVLTYKDFFTLVEKEFYSQKD